MKDCVDIRPNYAPVYAALYPAMAKIFQEHGYALAIHGSMARDFDVIAIPWATDISSQSAVIDNLICRFALQVIGEPTQKNHGRVAYTLVVGFGECAIDLSFTGGAQ